jgi:hypothetical protein
VTRPSGRLIHNLIRQPDHRFIDRHEGAIMASHVFISYSRTDRDYAQLLAGFLQGAGVPVWFDYEIQTGDRFGQKIQAAIDECHVFLPLITPASVASEWVGREISYAAMQKKRILPLRLGDCALPIEIAFLDCLDVRDRQLPPQRFIEQVRALVGAAPNPPQSRSPSIAHQLPRATGAEDTRQARPRRNKAIWLAALAILLSAGGIGGWTAWTRLSTASAGDCLIGSWAPTSFTQPATSIGGATVQLTGRGATVSYGADGKAIISYGQPGITYSAQVDGHLYERTLTGYITAHCTASADTITYTNVDNSNATYLDSVDARIAGQGATNATDFTDTYTCTNDTLTTQSDGYAATSHRQD